jgi:hypothetical protein
MRIFLASILNFVPFQCKLCIYYKILGKNFFDWTIMGGATIIPRSLKTTQCTRRACFSVTNFHAIRK